MEEQATREFHLSFGDKLDKLVKTYKFKMLRLNGPSRENLVNKPLYPNILCFNQSVLTKCYKVK